MPPLTARAAELSSALRVERVADLQRQITQGDFDAAHYASTPRRRAEILASVLTRAFSPSALKRRLRKLGVSREFCGGDLLAISVEGGGIDVRLPNGRGQVITGRGVDEQLLKAFPELLPFTLRNSILLALPGFMAVGCQETINSPFSPRHISLTGSEVWNLQVVQSPWQIIQVEVNWGVSAGTFVANNGSAGAPFEDVDMTGEFFHVHLDSVDPFPGYECFKAQGAYQDWPLAGRVWVKENYGIENAVVGPYTLTGDLRAVDGGCPTLFPPPSSWDVAGGFSLLRIHYDAGPCSTCSLDIQVNSSCDGDIVDGGVFSLGGVYECTQVDGTCTISGIQPDTYPWTWTHTGYDPQSGTFVCDCAGGPQTLFLSVAPNGGCPGTCTLEVDVSDFCDGEDLSGVLVVVDGEIECTTGADGVCTFAGLEPGMHTVVLSKPGYQSQERQYSCSG